MIAVVTGGTGFLGKRLVRQLLEQGHEVRCLVRAGSDQAALRRDLPSDQSARLTTFAGCLERPDGFGSSLHGCDVLYHVAAGLKGSVPALFLSNVVGTRGLIAQANRAGVGRLVLVSSLAVHGVGPLRRNSVVDETCPLDPEPHRRDPYTFSKIEQERVAWEAHRAGAVSLTVVRPGVIYGPGRDVLSGRVGLQLKNVLLKMGNQRLPYTFVDNCANAVLLGGTDPNAAGESFNVIDDAPPTGSQLLRRCRRQGKKLRVVRIPGLAIRPLSWACEQYHHWSRGQLPAVLTPYKSAALWKPLRYSNAKAKAILGWEPRVGFDEGLRATFDALKNGRPTAT
jgi:nucleoside-diphosphate-sugar epimerase